MDRLQLETKLEQEVFKLVGQIREHMYDHVMISVRRLPALADLDPGTVDRVLQVAKNAVDDGLDTKLDFFKEAMVQLLDAYTDEENPLAPRKRSKKQ
jgi:hypothetical protein